VLRGGEAFHIGWWEPPETVEKLDGRNRLRPEGVGKKTSWQVFYGESSQVTEEHQKTGGTHLGKPMTKMIKFSSLKEKIKEGALAKKHREESSFATDKKTKEDGVKIA